MIRIVGAALAEHHDEWIKDRGYYRLDTRCSYVDATSSAVGFLGVRRAWKIFRVSLTWGGA
jgi:hypothetical protein